MAEAQGSANSGKSESTPHIEIIDRVKNIPTIQSAIEKTSSTYSYVKDFHPLINWALSCAEAGLQYASDTAAPVAADVAKNFEGKIHYVDQKLCQGLNIIEQKVPIVTKPPEQIYEAARNVMSTSLLPTIEKLNSAKESAATLKEISVAKANELLDTQCGTMVLSGIDGTSVLVNRLLDRYFPAVVPDTEEPAPVSAEESKLLHSVQTVGQFSRKTAHRVYHSVAAQLKTINKDEAASYIIQVISILQLINFINMGEKQEKKQ